MVITQITDEHIPALIALSRRCFDESRYSDQEYDEQRVALHYVYVAKAGDKTGWVLIADGLVVGFCCAFIQKNTHSYETTAETESIYILPEFRGGWGCYKLLKSFLQWSTSRGAERTVVNISLSDEYPRTDRLMKLLGFEPARVSYDRMD